MLDIALLGTGGMTPMPKRFLSSMAARLNGKMIIIDCGEGTQVSLKNLGWGFKAIDAILFTHFHADHISGLPGMLLAIANSGRTEKLRLVGPKGLVYVVEGLRRIAQELTFEIEYIELDEKEETSLSIAGLDIKTLFVDHSVKCVAYRLEVRRKGRFDIGRAKASGLPKEYWGIVQRGETVRLGGREYTPDMVLGPSRQPIAVTFCTDSRPVAALPKFAEKSDLFICEGMYGENDKLGKAVENKHMLFSEAAALARQAGAAELWLTHFSPSIGTPEEFAKNAASIFENTVVGRDNMTKTLAFKE